MRLFLVENKTDIYAVWANGHVLAAEFSFMSFQGCTEILRIIKNLKGRTECMFPGVP